MPISASTYNYYKYENFKPKPEIDMGRGKQPYKDEVYNNKLNVNNDKVNDTVNDKVNDKVNDTFNENDNKTSILKKFGDLFGFKNDTNDTNDNPNVNKSSENQINPQKGVFTNLNLSNEHLSDENLNIKNILKKNRLLHNRIQLLEHELYIRNERY